MPDSRDIIIDSWSDSATTKVTNTITCVSVDDDIKKREETIDNIRQLKEVQLQKIIIITMATLAIYI